jgi:hypothetical protein
MKPRGLFVFVEMGLAKSSRNNLPQNTVDDSLRVFDLYESNDSKSRRPVGS